MGIHICGCEWVRDDHEPDAVDGEGKGWRKVKGCNEHPLKAADWG